MVLLILAGDIETNPGKGLKFCSININGIRDKILELVAVQDIKIDSTITTSELVPETCTCMYSVYRKGRNSHGGGVMLLIHRDTSHMPIIELENNSESVWRKIFAYKSSYYVASW